PFHEPPRNATKLENDQRGIAMLDRRTLVQAATMSAVAAHTMRVSATPAQPAPRQQGSAARSWEAIRGDFSVDRRYIHLAGLLLASHPKSVREAIQRYRDELDKNPVL